MQQPETQRPSEERCAHSYADLLAERAVRLDILGVDVAIIRSSIAPNGHGRASGCKSHVES